MAICMFCLQEKGKLTEEHVFPAALGGDLVVPHSVCAGCNHGFSEFEQPLCVELRPIRFLLQIANRRGEIPTVEATAKTTAKEYAARIEPGGRVRLKPIISEVPSPDGGRKFLYQYLSDRQKEKLAHGAKEKGNEFEQLPAGEPEEAEIHFGGDLEKIASSEGLRTAAKTAYVGLARFAGTGFVRSDAFAGVREYIKSGTGAHKSRLFVNRKYMEAVQQGPHQHSVTLAATKAGHRVEVIVRLFSHLAYFVELSDSYDGVDLCNTLVYDAYRGNIDGILLSHPYAEILQIQDVAQSADTIWSDAVATGTEFCDFLSKKLVELYERRQKELESYIPS